MKPVYVSLTIMLDLGAYQFKHLRFMTEYNENRLAAIRIEAINFAQSLEHVISFEIGEVYELNGPADEELPTQWDEIELFLEQHPHWEYQALWAGGLS
jgi:hypothetical protein